LTNTPNREQFFLQIWHGLDRIVGTEVDQQHFTNMWEMVIKPRKWMFVGRWATVYVITPESDITRSDALTWATQWMKGEVYHYAVDLDRCTVQITKGIEKTPHH